jgi:hybrid cluster-associated redox disulfide protein
VDAKHANAKMNKKMKKITKKSKFSEIIGDEKAREILMGRGMHCFGCPMAMQETIEQGAEAHGIDADELIKEINKKKKIK